MSLLLCCMLNADVGTSAFGLAFFCRSASPPCARAVALHTDDTAVHNEQSLCCFDLSCEILRVGRPLSPRPCAMT